jgi:hypothetical protein
MASVFDLFDIPRAPHYGEKKDNNDVSSWAKSAKFNHLTMDHVSGARFSRAAAATLFEKQHLPANQINDENACHFESSAKDDCKYEVNLPRHFSGLLCDAKRPAGATFSRTEAAELLVAYNRLNQV